MSRHLTNKMLMRLAAGTLEGVSLRAAREHAASCSACGDSYSRLSRVMAPSEPATPEPNTHVEDKLLRLYRRTAHSTPERSWTDRVREGYRPAYAAAVFVIAGLAWALLTLGGFTGKPLPINVSYLKGKAYLNNSELTPKTKITEECVIKVSKNSELVLSYNSTFTIKIGGGSVLEIKKGSIDLKNRKMEFVFSLERGTLFTKFDGINGASNYFYITPTAHIKSSRTEFTLKVAENKTIVIPRSGTLEIKSLESEEEIISLPNKKYIITSSIESKDTTELDEWNADRLKNMDNPFGGSDLSDIVDGFSDSI